MPQKDAAKELVAGTNDSCTLSKYSMHMAGYFKDDFIQYFISKSSKRSPLINRGYYVRAKAIERGIISFLETVSNVQYTESQIISLGSGFDSTFFRLKHEAKLPPGCTYYEVDFKSVVKRKLDCIKKHDVLKQLTEYESRFENENSNIVLGSPCYKLLDIDLEDTQLLKDIFLQAGIKFEKPTFLLSECVLTYLNTKCCDNLILWLAGNFPNAVFLIYEQILPFDGFGLVMRKHFESIGSPIRSVTSYPDILSQRQRYLSLGWKKCNIVDLNQFYFHLPEAERLRSQSLQTFDEFEEFHLKCSHYILACSQQGSFSETDIFGIQSHDSLDSNSTELPFTTQTSSPLRRFGHDAVLIAPEKAIVVGGFGERSGKHERLSGISQVNIGTGAVEELPIDDESAKLLGRRMHHKLILLDDGQILVTGGRESPITAFGPVLRLNLNTHIATITPVVTEGPKPKARWRHTATLQGNSVIIYGGRTSSEILGDCFSLNISSTWTRLSDGVARHSHAASCWGSKLIVSGGLTECGRPMSSIHVLKLGTHHARWEELPVVGLIPRYSHTSHIWQDSLFLIGGVHALPTNPPGIAVISLKTHVCREFSLTGSHLCLPILLTKHSSVILADGRIIVLGGGGNCFSFGTHLNSALVTVWK